jgi:radical SAM protein with 4Fe4S-binding SPASM domain
MTFLEKAKTVTERVRRGQIPAREELKTLKLENRQRAIENEQSGREYCDHLPTWINTTNSTVCNLKCIFCNQASGKGVDWKMDEETYGRIVEELYPFVETVQLTAYGEPMMTPNIYAKIRDLEQFSVKLEMVTNATLMKGEKLLKTMARTMGLLTVSMDGATKETFNGLRVGADFDEVVANVRAYMKEVRQLPPGEQPPLFFNTIIMRRNVHELPRFLELAKDLGASHVTVAHLVVFEECMQEETLDKHRELCDQWLKEARLTADKLKLSVNLPPLFSEDGKTSAQALPEHCYFLWRRVYIGPFGDVIPCCLSGIHKNGNLKDGTFAEVWNNDLYREMRRRVHTDDAYGPCKTCYLINRRTDKGQFIKL